MTRSQMKRAAMALMDDSGMVPGVYARAARLWNVLVEEINPDSPRYSWWNEESGRVHDRDDAMEASMLMSEACRTDFEVRR